MGRSLRQSGLTWTEAPDGTPPPRWDVGTDPEEYASFWTANDSGLRHLTGRCYTNLTLPTTAHGMHIQGSEGVSELMHTRWRPTEVEWLPFTTRVFTANSTVLVSTGDLEKYHTSHFLSPKLPRSSSLLGSLYRYSVTVEETYMWRPGEIVKLCPSSLAQPRMEFFLESPICVLNLSKHCICKTSNMKLTCKEIEKETA